jgi:NAD-dependent deacetylase
MQNLSLTDRFLSRLKKSQNVMVSTGAGISAESGVPTFRSPGGLWNNFRPEDLAHPDAFRRDPKQVWEWYDWRRQKYGNIQPNPGHYAVAELEKLVPRLHLFTQNVDGLHQKAGQKKVYELHGNIWRVRCTRESKVFELLESPLKNIPPRCECGAILRPDVVWFSEIVPPDMLELAYEAACHCDVFFAIGTSAIVQPAASLGWIAKENGAFVVEINPDNTPLTEIADQSFHAPSGELLPQLVETLRKNNE